MRLMQWQSCEMQENVGTTNLWNHFEGLAKALWKVLERNKGETEAFQPCTPEPWDSFCSFEFCCGRISLSRKEVRWVCPVYFNAGSLFLIFVSSAIKRWAVTWTRAITVLCDPRCSKSSVIVALSPCKNLGCFCPRNSSRAFFGRDWEL